ncbi:hypothetical protein GCM10027299_06610 [Larkinella ripae]
MEPEPHAVLRVQVAAGLLPEQLGVERPVPVDLAPVPVFFLPQPVRVVGLVVVSVLPALPG